MAGYIGSKSSVTQVDGYTEAEADAEFVNDSNGTITVSGSNVGIGASSPERALHVNSGTGNNVAVFQSTDADARVEIRDSGSTQGYNTISVTANEMYFGTNNTERMRITSSGHINISTDDKQIFWGAGSAAIDASSSNNRIRFYTNNSERMHIDSSGNVLVGKTTSSSSSEGCEFRDGGSSSGYAITATSNNNTTLSLNRTNTNGAIAEFRRDGTVHGSIGRGGSGFYISGIASSDFGVLFDGSGLISCTGTGVIRDNQYDMGHGGFRWDDIYATNGTIQTSDFNEKQDIASLTATEMLVGKRISALFKTFRWKNAVVEKGDNARTHTGVIAQDVQAAFTAEGLDAGDYALFTSFTWWEQEVEVPAVEAVAEVTDEDGNVTTKAIEARDAYTDIEKYNTEAEAPEGATSKTRLGIRYPELLSFVAAYNEQRFASIEARLTALEA